jgi:hypothetical protein
VSITIGDAVGYGWSAYWKNVGPMLLIALVVFAINVVFSLLAQAVDSTAAKVLIQIASSLVGLLITLGWMRVALEITRGVRPEVGDLFKASGYGPFIVASILFYIGTVIGLLLLIIPGIIFIATFGFYGFVIAERGDGVGIIESLQRSAGITRGHRWLLVGLAIVLFLINIVGLLACLVGVIFTSGITLIAWAYTYRTLSGEPIEYAAWGL